MNAFLKFNTHNLAQLFTALKCKGYMLIAPRLHDGAIIYGEVNSVEELPKGWTDEQSPATYRLSKETRERYFGYHGAPQSWKQFLYPPQKSLFRVRKNGKSLKVENDVHQINKYAFVGVRPCELNAILIQDKVFGSEASQDEEYKARRSELFTVVVNCTDSADNCFCASMETGPRAEDNFDLAMTEVLTKNDQYFLVEVGTEQGSAIVEQIESPGATEQEVNEAMKLIRHAENKMKKSIEISDLPKILANNLEHQHWDKVAKRCLACGNCTMVCPTCFCSSVEDITDLTGIQAERIQKWDSCFTLDFSKVAGGNFRITTKSRYRQWLTHKFSSWMEQFGVPGCVGCGRCITWCPVGIDITAEINSIRGEYNN